MPPCQVYRPHSDRPILPHLDDQQAVFSTAIWERAGFSRLWPTATILDLYLRLLWSLRSDTLLKGFKDNPPIVISQRSMTFPLFFLLKIQIPTLKAVPYNSYHYTVCMFLFTWQQLNEHDHGNFPWSLKTTVSMILWQKLFPAWDNVHSRTNLILLGCTKLWFCSRPPMLEFWQMLSAVREAAWHVAREFT